MAHILCLPVELIHKIFTFVSYDTLQDKGNLAALSLTTRHWTRVAQDLMFAELNLFMHTPGDLEQLKRLHQALSIASGRDEAGTMGRTAQFVSASWLDRAPYSKEARDLLRDVSGRFTHIEDLSLYEDEVEGLSSTVFANREHLLGTLISAYVLTCCSLSVHAIGYLRAHIVSEPIDEDAVMVQPAPMPFQHPRLTIMLPSSNPSMVFLQRLLVSSAPQAITSLSLEFSIRLSRRSFTQLLPKLVRVAPDLRSLSLSADVETLHPLQLVSVFPAWVAPDTPNFRPFLAACSQLKSLSLRVARVPPVQEETANISQRAMGDRALFTVLTYLPPTCKLRSLSTYRAYAFRPASEEDKDVDDDEEWTSLAAEAEQAGDMPQWIEPGVIPALDSLELWRIESSQIEALEAAAEELEDGDTVGWRLFLRRCPERGVRVRDARRYFEGEYSERVSSLEMRAQASTCWRRLGVLADLNVKLCISSILTRTTRVALRGACDPSDSLDRPSLSLFLLSLQPSS